jgi:hypothetical protein
MARAMKRTTHGVDAVNADVALRLEEVATLLEEQRANPYRVQAYRRAAETVRQLVRPVTDIMAAEGLEGLDALPGIGASLARTIYQVAATGRLPMLARLRGESDPIELLASLPGIGTRTAERIHDELGIHTLEELESAAHDGRLTEVIGLRGKRLAGLRDALAGRLGKVRQAAVATVAAPPVADILAVDSEYREAAAAGKLPRIAPRRFNPAHEAWLPVLHTDRDSRHYTALFSNTARAHSLGRTRDWVIVYVDGRGGERQYTVVTAAHGSLEGLRVVRGRESDCVAHYAETARNTAATANVRRPEHSLA